MTNFMPRFYYTHTKKKKKKSPRSWKLEEQHHIIPQAPPTHGFALNSTPWFIWYLCAPGKLLPSLFFIYHNSFFFFFLTRHGTMFEKSSLIRAWTLEHKLPGSKWQLCLRGATWQASSVKGAEQLTSLGQRVMHARGTQNSQDTSEQATHASRYQLHLLLITDGLIWDESRNIVVEKKNLSKE